MTYLFYAEFDFRVVVSWHIGVFMVLFACYSMSDFCIYIFCI